MVSAERISASSPLRSAVGVGGQPRNVEIDRDDRGDAADDGIAAGEDAAIEGAIADRDHPFRRRRRVIGPLQRLAHVLGHRTGDQQHVGMARRGDETEAEALEIVEGVVEGVDLELAAVAGAGIDLADRQAAAEPAARGGVERGGERGEFGIVGCGRGSVSGERNRPSKRSLRMRI